MAQEWDPRARNILVNFIKENFMDKEYSDTKVENMSDNIKIIKDTDKELIHMLTETNMLENGKNINIMEKVPTYTPTETNTSENGKKMNILLQIL